MIVADNQRKKLSELLTERAERADVAGLECPDCGCMDLRVQYTRPKGPARMRKRICGHCGRQITTFERITG
jgi:hypothetical protein